MRTHFHVRHLYRRNSQQAERMIEREQVNKGGRTEVDGSFVISQPKIHLAKVRGQVASSDAPRGDTRKTPIDHTLRPVRGARHGTISWQGKDITELKPNLRADLGIAWVPQEREIFPSLTVEENIRIASRVGGWTVDGVFDLFPRLKERRNNMGNQLSGGEQQMLAIGRALALNPKLLLLDEPLEGLAPIVAMEVGNCIKRLILEGGISVVLVEQHSSFALSLCQRAVVMDRGRVTYDGDSEKLLKNPTLLGSLIGVAHGVSIEQALS